MFGSKLRSWMEAVRPRKKQQRKEKQPKQNAAINFSAAITQNSPNFCSPNTPSRKELLGEKMQSVTHTPRYSGANLSSPESAYSTGYSTDGTSPGVPPPEYYINIRAAPHSRERCKEANGRNANALQNTLTCLNEMSPRPLRTPRLSASSRASNLSPKAEDPEMLRERERLSGAVVHFNGEQAIASAIHEYGLPQQPSAALHGFNNQSNGKSPSVPVTPRLSEVVVNSALTSPRQRNRIRTNPWLPSGSNLSPCNSVGVLHGRQQEQIPKALVNSPIRSRYAGPALVSSPIKKITRYSSLSSSSSSSCSSLSAASLHWDASLVKRNPISDDEDDCTLNEMMGKYDESYVYEKETDILSDSDPTDCDDDIDTGQDGGDEDEPQEQELDFIDNGPHADYGDGCDERNNTGHCTYHSFEVQRRISSSRRRNVVRRSHRQTVAGKQIGSDKRKRCPSSTVAVLTNRHCSSKKRHRHPEVGGKFAQPPSQIDGSKSAGATPLSARRTKPPVSKLALEHRLRKRSNSVNFCGDAVRALDKRDKEADRKYQELIVEAERILNTMKSNGFSPRRLPGPANKRVEFLRTAESATKPDVYVKSRLSEDLANVHLTRIPSNNYNSPRFSPKRNHITNFINSNSPVLLRKEAPAPAATETPKPKSKLAANAARRSPTRYKKKAMPKKNNSSDSDEEDAAALKPIIARGVVKNPFLNDFDCPQSEPVKRKVYTNHRSKQFHYNASYDSSSNIDGQKSSADDERKGSENLRHQVLLNTIVNLKKSLEDQSASLQQVYQSSQNLQVSSFK